MPGLLSDYWPPRLHPLQIPFMALLVTPELHTGSDDNVIQSVTGRGVVKGHSEITGVALPSVADPILYEKIYCYHHRLRAAARLCTGESGSETSVFMLN